MKRSEKGMILLAGLVVGCFVASILTGAAVYLNGVAWFGGAANEIQWTSGPSTFAVVVVAMWARWHSTCAVPWCFRHGEHPVKGTLKKVCHSHHTLKHHRIVHDLHAGAHALSGRLNWGESHDRLVAPSGTGATLPSARAAT